MKKNLVILICLFVTTICLAAKNDLPASHPLKDKNFKIIDYPISKWDSGWMYLNDVMGYILKSPEEKLLAIEKLAAAGYGESAKQYVYVAKNNQIVINNMVFDSREAAKKYIKGTIAYIHNGSTIGWKTRRMLYLEESDLFPEQIPEWLLGIVEVEFWLLNEKK